MKTFKSIFLFLCIISMSGLGLAAENCTANLVNLLEAGHKHELTPDELGSAVERGYRTTKEIAAYAGSEAHKADRWATYLARSQRGETNNWEYERWSKTYDQNIVRSSKANEIAEAYRRELGWGRKEVDIPVPFDFGRRLDIADRTTRRGVEVKSGYATHNVKHRQQIEADRYLVQQKGWTIEWRFDGTASEPLLEALDEAGISHSFRLQDNI